MGVQLHYAWGKIPETRIETVKLLTRKVRKEFLLLGGWESADSELEKAELDFN
jgi:hypothetical protein